MSCKLNVILDIDETFVYFINKKYRANSWDKLPESEKSKYKFVDSSGHILILRPNIDKFFDYLFKNCTVSVWTWSDEDYAQNIVDKVVLKDRPYEKLRLILSDNDAAQSGEIHGWSKDLNYLWYGEKTEECFAECNTILIDDLSNNTIHPSNKKNSITIAPFALFGEIKDRSHPYTDVSGDTTLLEVVSVLEKAKGLASGCYEDDDRHWTNIFTPENIKKAGLQKYVRTIQYSPYKKAVGPPVQAIGVGESYLFVSKAGRRTKRHLHRKRRRTLKH